MTYFSLRRRSHHSCVGAWPDTATAALPNPNVETIASAQHRRPVVVRGKIRSIRVQPRAGVPTTEVRIFDDTASLTVVFSGRRSIAGLAPGRHIEIEGVIGEHRGQSRTLNPVYRILS